MKEKGCARKATFEGYFENFQKSGFWDFKAKIANIAYDRKKQYLFTKHVVCL